MTPGDGREAVRILLAGMTKVDLITLCKGGIPNHRGGHTTVWGAHPLEQWTKDDLMATVMDVLFPPACLLEQRGEGLS